MSHLLSSVNPEAAIEMHEMPPIGMRVQFFARPGSGRGGKTVFPADVTFTDARKGTITVNVYFGKEDWVEYEHVRVREEQNPYHCWDYLPDGYEALANEVDELQTKVEALEQLVISDYNPVMDKETGKPKSIYEMLEEFEARVFAAEGKKPKK